MAGHDTRAARRYAGALFNTAQRQDKLDAVVKDLDSVLALMDQTPLLRKMWESPEVPTGRKRDIIGDILGQSVDGLTLSFLRLLVDKRREDILDAVRVEIHQLADEARHLVRAEAVFALAPTPEEQKELIRSLEQRTGENVELTVHVDPDILGGVVVRMHDTIIDGSVRGTLERLREQLLQEA
ncbi:MAG TPA: ATP synthase F1 subunit delta [Chthonomonadaceae bacterium]|nr:ATP synthase F1 subunit delta [Chthonomonadaceae bacterium]